MNSAPIRKQRGQVMVLFVLLMFALLGFGALAIDTANLYLIRNQLQNAADAAALSGANYLYPFISSGPNWSQAQTKATATARLNSVDGVLLTDATVQTGFWNITGTPSTLQATTITPGQYDLTAVQVTISKMAGVNGGPVNLIFGPIIGIKTANVSAQAVAVTGAPSMLKAGQLFPLAMAKSVYDTYWNTTTNSPKINPSTGQPYTFQVGGSKLGQGAWTTFNANSNSSSTVRDFVVNRSPINYKMGDNIWITTGSKTSAYGSVPPNIDVLIPVVVNVNKSGLQQIVAFGAIHIDFASSSGKYVQMHFITNYKSNSSAPGGYSYGVYTPSRLAK